MRFGLRTMTVDFGDPGTHLAHMCPPRLHRRLRAETAGRMSRRHLCAQLSAVIDLRQQFGIDPAGDRVAASDSGEDFEAGHRQPGGRGRYPLPFVRGLIVKSADPVRSPGVPMGTWTAVRSSAGAQLAAPADG